MPMLTTLFLAVLATSADPETSKGSCAEYVASYRTLLRERAEAETNPAPDRAPAGVPAASAQQDAAKVFELVRGRIEQSCREANRSGWACVVQAATYAELASCREDGLPLVLNTARVHDARTELEASAPRPPTDPTAVVRSWVLTGTIELSPELTRAAFDAPATSPSSAPAR